MQTVNFMCGHCNKLMAVGLASLGMQVRCPHCQQVVVAPNSTSNSSPTSSPEPEKTPASQQELSTSFVPFPTAEDNPGPASSLTEPSTVFLDQPQEPQDTGSPLSFPGRFDSLSPNQPFQDSTQQESSNHEKQASSNFPEETPSLTSARRPQPQKSNWFLWALVLPLLSYAFLSTILLFVLYNQYRNAANNSDRLFNLPDEAGDNPGVKKGKTTWKWEISPKLYREPIPSTLLATLGKGHNAPTLHVGDLDVTPVKVEQKLVKVFVEGSSRPEPCDHPSLVLTLRLKNNATDYSFVPLDNYFDRHFAKATKDDPYAPLTQLEIGTSLFSGGPAHWEPRYGPDQRIPLGASRREWVEGRQNIEPELAPGKEIETFVCTDGNNESLAKAIAGSEGPFLWRVHLRRGLTTYQGKEFPRTAVVGIQFNRDVIEKITP